MRPSCACAVRSRCAQGGAARAPGGVGGPWRRRSAEPRGAGGAPPAPSEPQGAAGRAHGEAAPRRFQTQDQKQRAAAGGAGTSVPPGLRARAASRGRAGHEEPASGRRGGLARGGWEPGAAGLSPGTAERPSWVRTRAWIRAAAGALAKGARGPGALQEAQGTSLPPEGCTRPALRLSPPRAPLLVLWS